MAELLEFVWEYLRPLKRIKKCVKFSIKIPHLTSTAYHLLSDRLLWWKEPILASCSLRGFPFSTYIRKGLFSLIFFLLATTHLGTWTGEGCTSSRGPRYKAAMKDRTKYLLRAISSRDSNSDREYTTPKHPKLLIPGYDAEVEEIDSALEAKPRWNKVKRSLTLLRKNSIRFLRARLEKVTCPKIQSYNVWANIAIDEDFQSDIYRISSSLSRAIFQYLTQKFGRFFHKKRGSAYSGGFGIKKQVQI